MKSYHLTQEQARKIAIEQGFVVSREDSPLMLEMLHAFANAALDQALSKQWISVEDRLPEPDHCHVMMAADSGLVCSTFYSIIGHPGKHYTDNVSALFSHAHDYGYKVTHWMPLPSAPKELS